MSVSLVLLGARVPLSLVPVGARVPLSLVLLGARVPLMRLQAFSRVPVRMRVYARMRTRVRERLLFVAVIVIIPIRFDILYARTHARFLVHAPVFKIPIRVAHNRF